MDEIVQFYELTTERERLSAGSGLLELERSREIISRWLPPAPARILDVGGGPGVYSGWLAGLGYEAYLLDPVEKHLNEARALPLAGVVKGDARALPWHGGFADAVLLMGPLYHLVERQDRARALSEARRVLRPGGYVFAAAISRFASLFHSLVDGFVDDNRFWPILRRDLAEGLHINETGELKYFTTAAFHRPAELKAEMQAAGFAEVEVLGVEGPGWLARDFDERWQDERRRARLLELTRRVETEADILGCSLHLLGVGVNR